MDLSDSQVPFVVVSYALTVLSLVGLLALGFWRVRSLQSRLERLRGAGDDPKS